MGFARVRIPSICTSSAIRGMQEALDVLKENAIPLAIISNKPEEFTIKCVEKFLSAWEFQEVIGAGDRYKKKPDPGSAFAIAESISMNPAEMIFIGDSGVDMQTAVAAGMQPVGVSWGFRSPHELEENGAQIILESPADIPKLFR